MIYALGEDGERIEATPGGAGFCPSCDEQLIPRCGRIYVHHWAHKGEADCDPWSEHDTLWHLDWKSIVRPDACEVAFGNHRADIVGNRRVVIELQYTTVSVNAIEEREEFYAKHGGMIWVIDAEGFRDRLILRDRGEYHTFRWKQPRRSHCFAGAPMFWDFCDGTMLRVKKIHEDLPCGGWGYLLSREWFVNRYLSNVLDVSESRLASFTNPTVAVE